MNVDVPTGSVLSGYRIERLIGAGATGAVYLARDETLDRPVAIKLLAPELARDERFQERFLRESRAAARIEHPGIVPIYAAGEADGRLFIAMRYVAGGDLTGVIEREGRMDASRALTLLGQVASGLDAAHEQGLIHRDVKPGNILVDGDHAWLGDFGLAKHAATVNSLSRDTTFAGTVHYIAPEQIQGGDVDGRADVYALGCVLFECLTGRAPYERDNDLAVVFAHLRDPAPSVTALRDDLPDSLDKVVERALAKNPDQRYATCAELIDDARTAISGGDVVVPPPGAPSIRTFLICDVRGYTRYTQQHGDEAAAELAATFADLVRHEVQRFEGRLIELRGDEALVTFTSARQAVRAALAIQRAVAEHDLPRGVGVGLDSGEAVPVGAGYRGGALNMAARLCSMAEPGQVLATEGVVHLARKVEGARYLTGQVARLKGIEKPVRVIEVVPQERGDEILQRLRRRAKGRRWRRLAVPIAGVAAALTGLLLIRGGSDQSPALADTTRPHTIAVFDTRTGKYVRTALGHQEDPGYLLAEGKKVWSLDNGVVLIIDPATDKVVKRIPVGDSNYMSGGDGSLWIGSANGPTVTRIDPVYGTTVKPVFHLPTDDMQDWNHAPDGIVYAAGSLWVAHGFQNLRRVDPVTGKVEHTWPMFGVKEVAAGDGAVFAASNDSGTLYRIDPSDNHIVWKARLHPWIDQVLIAGGYAWLTTNSDETLFKFDLGTGDLVKSIPTGSADSRMVAGDGAVWVENSRGGTVTRVDVATDRTRTFPVGHSPAGLALVGHELWVGLTPSPEDELKGVTGKVAKISLREDWLDSQSDPATTWGTTGQQLEYATQLKLYNYPDRNGAAGGVPVPEAATGTPQVSDGGRTVTIRVRPGFRFSPPSNAPVTAETFRYSIERAFALGNAPLFLPELVGSSRFTDGKARHISGLSARGDTLTLRLTKPIGDILQILAMPFFSAVPEGTPFEQVNEPMPSAGPYYIVKHDWYVVVKRNPNYRGERPQRLDAIVYQINLDTATAAARAIDGRMDVVMDPEGEVLQPNGDLARRYGTATEGHPRYLRYPIRGTHFLTLNYRGPLRDVTLRRAINYAIDRPALAAPQGNFVTDHYLPAGMPGAQLDRHVYPVDGPDLAAARRLMHGRRLTLSLWTCDKDFCAERARLLKAELGRIGIHLHVRAFSDLYGQGNGYDVRDDGWVVDEFDPVNMLGVPMFGQPGYLDDPTFVDARWQRRVSAVDALRPDQGRYRAFGRLELQMMRDASPWAAYGQQVDRVFLSARVGCTVVSPVYGFDLTTMCVDG